MAEIIKARIKATNEINLAGGGGRTDALMALYTARKNKDHDAIQKAEAACDVAFTPERDVYRKAEDKLDRVLAPEQRQKVMAAPRNGMHGRVGGRSAAFGCPEEESQKRLRRSRSRRLRRDRRTPATRNRGHSYAGATQRHFPIPRLETLAGFPASSNSRKSKESSPGRLSTRLPRRIWKQTGRRSRPSAKLERKIEELLTADQKKRLTVSASYGTNFRRPSCAGRTRRPNLRCCRNR